MTELSILGVLLAGLVSFISPCFFPVVPVFVGYLAGNQNDTRRHRWNAAIQALIFMAGFTFVFMCLWGLVGLIGLIVGSFRQWLSVIGGIILVIMGLHMSGLIHISLLDKVLKTNYSPDQTQPPNLRRSLLLGLAFGAGWTPCIGPILGGVLGLATTSDSWLTGVLLMAVYSIGLGIPFVLVCAGASAVMNRLKWFMAHQRGVNIGVGIFLIIVGFLMIADLFHWLSAWVPFSI